MIPYIFQVTVTITVCFLFYKVLLQKETFYRLNRWMLMVCLAVSFVLPLLPAPRQFSWRAGYEQALSGVFGNPEPTRRTDAVTQPTPQLAVGSPQNSAQPTKPVVPFKRPDWKSTREYLIDPEDVAPVRATTVEKQPLILSELLRPAHARVILNTGWSLPSGSSVLQWLLYVYGFGILVFGANFFLQIFVLLYQTSRGSVIRDGRFRIVETIGERAPCSFGNYIFINPTLYDWQTYHQILLHEKVHVNGRHTFDIMLAEAVVVLQWFNPFVWLYRKEVENNLEFLTDQSVLRHQEVERSAYQLSLLRVSAPHLPFSVTTNYNQSLLKRRIVMMNSQHSSLRTIWKYFFLLPVLSLLICALNKPALFAQTVTIQGHTSIAETGNSSNHQVQSAAPTASNTPANRLYADTVVPKKKAGSADPLPQREHAETEQSAQSVQNVETSVDLKSDNVQVKALGILDPLTVKVTTKVFTRTVRANEGYEVAERGSVEPGLSNEKYDPTEGSWFVTPEDGKLSFELKGESDLHSWSNSFTVEKSEINPFPGQGTVEFKLVREAGTILFKGQFDGQQGFGHYKFTADDSFLAFLKQQGVEELEEKSPISFFLVDVKKSYVTMIIHNGYPHISKRNLISMSALHVDEPFIKSWQQNGYNDLEERELVSAKALHIEPSFAQEIKAAGYDHLPMRDLTSLKAMHIDGQYISSFRASYGMDLPAIHEIISYKASRIDSGYLASLKTLGYGNLPIRDLIALHSMRITADFIKSFQVMGFKDIPARNLISLKSMNISPEFIKGFKDIGYTDIDLHELSSLKAMGVTPGYALEFKNIGYDHVPLHELRSLKSLGIDAAYVTKMKAKGFDSPDLNKYIRLKNAFE